MPDRGGGQIQVEPRPAATVVIARPADEGVEVLVLRRAAGSRFAPGFVVFPGGVIESQDEPLGARFFGHPQEAPRACALRELYEETGLLLTAAGLEARPERGPIEDLSFDPPPVSDLVEMARWIAPEFLPVRFDARFFVIAAPLEVEPTPDGIEIDRAWWARPADVLAASSEGEAPLMWPTMVTLDRLQACASVEEVLALRVEQVPPVAPGPSGGRR
ncbi:MAG: NUDIX hydrolase [Actinomycetota bacterium]